MRQEFQTLHKEVIHPYTQEKLFHTMQDHIRRSYDSDFAISICPFEGLPIIWINQESFIDNPDPEEQFKAVIAHELGHYILKHLKSDSTGSKSTIKKLKEAYSRVEEYEADRSMILDFHIPIKTFIEIAQTFKERENSDSRTFESTHPLWADRIKHIKSLQPEAELRKARDQSKTQFNWKALADEYLKALN